MKNSIVNEVLHFVITAAKRFKQHVLELLNPETPSYKTSASVVPLFAIFAVAASDRQGLFWLSIACMLFFIAIAVAQYGVFSKNKNKAS